MDIDPQPITNWFLLVLAVLGTITTIVGVVYRVNRNFEKRVSSLIVAQTKPIQAETNGGYSLTDLHHKTDLQTEKINKIEHRYNEVIAQEETQRDLWHARYEIDQKRIRQEWTAVFIAIRKMIHLPPKEQIEMWDAITDAYIDGTITEKHPDERKSDESVQ